MELGEVGEARLRLFWEGEAEGEREEGARVRRWKKGVELALAVGGKSDEGCVSCSLLSSASPGMVEAAAVDTVATLGWAVQCRTKELSPFVQAS